MLHHSPLAGPGWYRNASEKQSGGQGTVRACVFLLVDELLIRVHFHISWWGTHANDAMGGMLEEAEHENKRSSKQK